MFDLGGGELLLILVAVLVLFGPKKLPELAQGLGKGLRQFKQAQQEFTEQINSAFADEQRKEYTRKAQPGASNTVSRPITTVQNQNNTVQNNTSGQDTPVQETPDASTPDPGSSDDTAETTPENTIARPASPPDKLEKSE